MNEKKDKQVKLMLGDNISSLKKLLDNSIDSIVSDPPYGLSFMGKKWDYDVPSVEFWKEVYRVLKPGGHIVSFGGTRTYHRMVVNIEDAGFEIRDQIMWLYGSGFPKSLNVGLAIDKLNGLTGNRAKAFVVAGQSGQKDKDTGGDLPNPNTKIEPYKAQNEFEGWGTALKPANEPICLARKPLSEKSVAENVLKWKTGGINIDGCRVSHNEDTSRKVIDNINNINVMNSKQVGSVDDKWQEGRFPANLILECCCDEVIKGEKGDIHTNPECPCYVMDSQSGVSRSSKLNMKLPKTNSFTGLSEGSTDKNEYTERGHNDKGGASRFFYQAKVSKKERNMGLDGFEEVKISINISGLDDKPNKDGSIRKTPSRKNTHPTVKPVSLMTYLCRMITPEGGIVLDPFMGSGSTGIAARLEGFRFIGMEMEPDYFKIAEARIENYEKYREFLKNK